MISIISRYENNLLTTINIENLGAQGDGAATIGADKVFIPFAAPGDRIDYDLHGKKAAALQTPGAERRPPPCPHHGNIGKTGCGGCRLQHVSEENYKDWKWNKVARAVTRIGITAAVIEPIQTSPPYSRRRAALAAKRQGNQITLGFSERGSHSLVDLSVCLVLKPELTALFEPLRRLPILRDGEAADYRLTSVASGVQFLLERRREPDLNEREVLAAFAQEHNLAGIAWRAGPRREAEPIAQLRPLLTEFGGVTVALAADAFLQATAEGEAAMVDIMRQAQPSPARTLDLFAGSGTFTFPAAAAGPVHAVEANPRAIQSIKAARHTAITTQQRDLFSDPLTGKELRDYNFTVFDPPYAGARAQAAELAGSDISVIVAISCNPISFAEDAALLLAGGYQAERIVPIDQFLWSAEVEVVGVFRR